MLHHEAVLNRSLRQATHSLNTFCLRSEETCPTPPYLWPPIRFQVPFMRLNVDCASMSYGIGEGIGKPNLWKRVRNLFRYRFTNVERSLKAPFKLKCCNPTHAIFGWFIFLQQPLHEMGFFSRSS